VTPYLDAMLAAIPVWLAITPLVGVVNAALFFLIAGRRPSSLPIYVALGVGAASLTQAAGLVEAGSPPLSLGDVHLVVTSLAAWATLVVTRLLGL
jgi:hypothetical protein